MRDQILSGVQSPVTSPERSAEGLRAVILAGGKGRRLLPFTASFPKPLVPIGDIPVVEILIRQLLRCGITDITLTLGHLAELLKAYFYHRKSLVEEINLRYVQEDTPTGTAGSLTLVPGLDRTFLVMNGDLVTNLDFHALVRFHQEQKAVLTIATHERKVKVDLGVLEFNSECRIVGYHEKPETTYHISMGIYVYEPAALRYIEPGRPFDFPDLVLRLIDNDERVCAFLSDCLWLDIGRPDDYARAQELFAEQRADFDMA